MDIKGCNGRALEENLKPAQSIDHHEDDLIKGRRIRSGALYLAHLQFIPCGSPGGATEEPSKEDENAEWNQ